MKYENIEEMPLFLTVQDLSDTMHIALANAYTLCKINLLIVSNLKVNFETKTKLFFKLYETNKSTINNIREDNNTRIIYED